MRRGKKRKGPKGQALPKFSANICYGQRAGWIKMPLGREVGLGPRDIVLDGDLTPHPPKGDRTPIFGPCLLWPISWMDQDGTWDRGRRRPRPHCARRGPSSPPQIGSTAPQFSVHVYCGQTAGWIKMPLGMEVGLGPGFVRLKCPSVLTSVRTYVRPSRRSFSDFNEI